MASNNNEAAVKWFIEGVYARNNAEVSAYSREGQALIALSRALGFPAVESPKWKLFPSMNDKLRAYAIEATAAAGESLQWPTDKEDILLELCKKKPEFAQALVDAMNNKLSRAELKDKVQTQSAASAGESELYGKLSTSTGLTQAQNAIDYLTRFGMQNRAHGEEAKEIFSDAIKRSGIPTHVLNNFKKNMALPFANDPGGKLHKELNEEMDTAIRIARFNDLQKLYEPYKITLERDPEAKTITRFILRNCDGVNSNIMTVLTGVKQGNGVAIPLDYARLPDSSAEIVAALASAGIRFNGEELDCSVPPPPPPPPPKKMQQCDTEVGKDPASNKIYFKNCREISM